MAATVPPRAAVLATIPDFRSAQGRRHPLRAMLLLACAAMLCGATGESAIAEWAANYGQQWRERLGFTHPKGPHQSTVQRVLKGIDCAALEAAVARWARQVLAAAPVVPLPLEAMAIDGKTLRASSKGGATHAHLLSALSQRLGVVLGQVAVPDKTNEIMAIDTLLEDLVLDGWVVTTDAMFAHATIAQTIIDAGGDYLMAVKENQPTLLEDATILFADPATQRQVAQETRLHGGRLEQRILAASAELAGYSDWPGLAQVLCVERRGRCDASGRTRPPRCRPPRRRPHSCWCCGANTGTSRTSCTGCAMSRSTKTAPRCVRGRSRKRWRRCTTP